MSRNVNGNGFALDALILTMTLITPHQDRQRAPTQQPLFKQNCTSSRLRRNSTSPRQFRRLPLVHLNRFSALRQLSLRLPPPQITSLLAITPPSLGANRTQPTRTVTQLIHHPWRWHNQKRLLLLLPPFSLQQMSQRCFPSTRICIIQSTMIYLA